MPPPNRLPNAKLDLVTPLPVRVGQPIEVDASGTTDPDNSQPAHKWRWGVTTWEGTRTVAVSDTGKPGRATLPAYETPGVKDILLAVTDPKGGKDADTLVVDVQPAVTVPPELPPELPPPGPIDTSIVPAFARTTWAPGVQGGIPARDTDWTIGADEFGNGTIESSAGIQAILDHCPSGVAIALSEGTFLCNHHILLNRGITLRGAGRGLTTLVKTNGAKPDSYQPEEAEPVVVIGPSRWPKLDDASSVALEISGSKGSYLVKVVDATGFAAGQFVLLDQDDYSAAAWLPLPDRHGEPNPVRIWASDVVVFAKHDPPAPEDDPFPDSLSWFSRPGRPVNEIKEIASVDGNLLTFTTPLHMTYLASKHAQVTRYLDPHVRGAGLEDLTVTGGSDSNVVFANAAYSWLKNVDSTAWLGQGVKVDGCFRVEVRDSYIHDGVWPYPGGGGYGIGLSWGSSEILVENNIVSGMNKVLVVQSCGAGSVVGYNYMDNGFIGNYHDWVEVGINGSHMVGGHHILFEGNQSNNYDSDDTHGSAFAMTVFRNQLTGVRQRFPGQDNARCVGLMFGSWWHAFIGNVLGSLGLDTTDWAVNSQHPWPPGMWKLGYAPAHWEQAADPLVLATVLRDGNWDHVTKSVIWDRPEQPVPDSLYLTAKPAFFGGLTWPWVTPLDPTKTAVLPARARFDALVR